MSRKTARFARTASAYLRKHPGKVEGDHLYPLFPFSAGVVKGAGTYLQNVPNVDGKGPHDKRGEGNICSRPMHPDKRARLIRSLSR